VDLLLFILVCFGLTQIVCYGKIFDQVRPTEGKLGELFSCSMCTGFWVGFIISALEPLFGLFNLCSSPFDPILLGFLSSGTTYILDKIVSDEGIVIKKG
jgi:hypothetical protein